MAFLRILRYIHEAIIEGRLAPGSRVPTEKELSEQYQVSRITSKRALTELEQNQLIYRVQGSGSFVRELKERSSSCCCLAANSACLLVYSRSKASRCSCRTFSLFER